MQVSHEIVNQAHSASQTKQSSSSNTMEHLNRIELVGTLWSIYVNGFGTTKVGTLVIVTQCEHFAQDGCKTIETTWHHITAWESEEIKNLNQLEVGSTVHIVGRLRVRKRTRATGEPVTVHDIVANKVEIVH